MTLQAPWRSAENNGFMKFSAIATEGPSRFCIVIVFMDGPPIPLNMPPCRWPACLFELL